ncbi:MAG: C4-dicarboxylate TRAP transporter substrate-binding protein [Proteobacteria bacterium]|nr:C4-dicarboxylate TRAP transporter substrate-binding protein [Pseudomonadota bacterium]MBU1452435.1 C4-dicarboxylate TRAP transporter substrate-binding protein [Pseudomonadota bacterium]MBU2518254.1 C4-dicarboxylate TRAP transporter substrate-binding protein [Pseudomonadota bacterium]
MKAIKALTCILALALLLATAVFTSAGDAWAEKKVINLKIGMAKPIQAGKAFSIVKEIFQAEVSRRVAAETPYEVKWTEAFGGTVAKDGEVLEAVQMGLLDIGYVIYLFEPAKLFLHNFGYFVPFSSSDQVMVNEITGRLFDEFPVMRSVFETQYGQKMLCNLTASSYQLITTFPVNSIADLKGKKIAAGGPNLIVVKPLGAVPVQSSIGEGYTSFKMGVYQGWIILESIMAGLKWPEVAPYVTVIDLGSPPAAALTMNLRSLEKLPPEVRAIVLQAGKHLAVAGPKTVQAFDEKIRGFLAKSGAKVSRLPQAQRLKWADALPEVAKLKAKEADKRGLPGTALIKRYIQMQQEAGYVFPRNWQVD